MLVTGHSLGRVGKLVIGARRFPALRSLAPRRLIDGSVRPGLVAQLRIIWRHHSRTARRLQQSAVRRCCVGRRRLEPGLHTLDARVVSVEPVSEAQIPSWRSLMLGSLLCTLLLQRARTLLLS